MLKCRGCVCSYGRRVMEWGQVAFRSSWSVEPNLATLRSPIDELTSTRTRLYTQTGQCPRRKGHLSVRK